MTLFRRYIPAYGQVPDICTRAVHTEKPEQSRIPLLADLQAGDGSAVAFNAAAERGVPIADGRPFPGKSDRFILRR